MPMKYAEGIMERPSFRVNGNWVPGDLANYGNLEMAVNGTYRGYGGTDSGSLPEFEYASGYNIAVELTTVNSYTPL